jgi:hypothetical protein
MKMISSSQNDIQDLKVSIEFLTNFDKLFDMQDRVKKSLEQLQYESFLSGAEVKDKKKKLDEEWEKMNKVRSNYVVYILLKQKNDFKRESDIKEKQIELLQKDKAKDELINKLEDVKKKIKLVQAENKDIKNELLVHYHKLLNEGRDTRKEGLMWLVKVIWDLGQDILVSYLPTFLDENAIAFIFQV